MFDRSAICRSRLDLAFRRPEQVRAVWRFADAAVVGSAIVREIENLDKSPDLVKRVSEFARSLINVFQHLIFRMRNVRLPQREVDRR